MNDSNKDKGIELRALNGDNPLGFLAALGVVAVLHQTGEKEIRLSWKHNFSWTPSLQGFAEDKDALVKKLAVALKGRTVSKEAIKEEQKTKKAFETSKKTGIRQRRGKQKRANSLARKRKGSIVRRTGRML